MAANLTTKLGQLVDVLTPDTTNTRIGVANASPTHTLDVTGTGAFSGLLTASAGVSSTLVTDATSATTGSIITAGGISTQKALWVGTTSQLVGAATFNARINQSLTASAAEYALKSSGQTTGWIAIDMANTGGSYIVAGENSAGNNLITGDSAYDMVIRGPSGISFSANAGSTQHMRLTSGGSLCVNATSTIFAEKQRISYNGAGEQGLVVNDSANTNGSNYVIFYTNGAQRGSITNNAGTGVLFNVSSDERLKTWRTDQRDFRSMILGVDVGDVEWKSVPGSRTLAVMAQQTNEFYPDAITPGKTDADMWQADYGRLAPLALWGVKDLYKIIDELTTRLAALESK